MHNDHHISVAQRIQSLSFLLNTKVTLCVGLHKAACSDNGSILKIQARGQ
jgi:hypothetical protein